MKVSWVLTLGLALRLAFAGFTELGSDQKKHYELGLVAYQGHALPVTAAPNVYNGSARPGTVVPLAMTLPLYLSGGHPIGPAIFFALLSFVTALLTFRTYRRLFPRLPEAALAGLVALSPWGVLFNSLWEPSLLPICGWLFLEGWSRILHQREPDARGSAFVFAAVVLAFQIHLSFTLLGGLALIAGALHGRRIHKSGALAGTTLAAIPLVPYLLSPPGAAIRAGLLESVVWTSASLPQLLSGVFLRLASFPTGETTRFIGHGQGFAGALQWVNAHSWIWPLFVVGMGLSVASVLVSLRFYFEASTYRDPLRRIVACAPILALGLFLFSIKPPSAHTIWILWPMSFFPLLAACERSAWIKKRASRLVTVLVATSLVYSIGFVLANRGTAIFEQGDYIQKAMAKSGP